MITVWCPHQVTDYIVYDPTLKRVHVEKLDNSEMIVLVIMRDKWYIDDKHADGVRCYSSILSNDANYIQQKSVYLIHWKTFYRY